MKRAVAFLCMALSGAPSCHLQKDARMTNQAKGTFDVKVTPQAQDDPAGGPFNRLVLDKRFHGDLDGGSQGPMLATETPVEGSAGYVALRSIASSDTSSAR
jgi:hypothetical protein